MVPLNLVRAALGLLTLFFAHFLGRMIVRLRQGRPGARPGGWAIRFAVALGAILWSGGLDATAIVTLAGAGLAGGYGAWRESRPKKDEDLSELMFPKQ
jgi:hypothetical protein